MVTLGEAVSGLFTKKAGRTTERLFFQQMQFQVVQLGGKRTVQRIKKRTDFLFLEVIIVGLIVGV